MKIKIQSNFNNLIMELIIYAIFIVQFLPLVNVFGKLVVNGISLLLLIAFLVVVLCINRRLSVEFLVILSISILYNLYCYHQCWRKYTSFWGFMIENTMCWGMILVGWFCLEYGILRLKHGLSVLIKFVIIFTAISSIIVLFSYPEACRGLGNGMKEVTNISELELYRKNTASWSITYGMTYAFPFFIAQYEEDKKRSSLFFLVVLLFFMVKCELMFALVYAICFLLYFGWEKIPNYIKVISSILIFLCAVLIIFSAKDIVYWLYITLDGKVPKLTLLRIYQLYVTLQQNSLYGNFAGRFELYFNSINSFFKHPLLGTIISNQSMYTAIGLHSQILDMLAATGIVVFIPVAYMFFYIIKRISLKIKNTNVKKRFYFLILMLILFMILNPVYYSSCIFLIIFSYPFLIGK